MQLVAVIQLQCVCKNRSESSVFIIMTNPSGGSSYYSYKGCKNECEQSLVQKYDFSEVGLMSSGVFN